MKDHQNVPDGDVESNRARAETLLLTYPRIADHEAEWLVRFIKKGDPLEVALLTTKDDVRNQLARFRAERPSDFALGTRHYAGVLLLVLLLLALGWYLWDIGAGT